jgi:hypothetical protein
MSRSHYYPFWKAPLRLWVVRIGFGPFGLALLYLFITTVWDAATKNAFALYRLRGGSHPITISYLSAPHWFYWGVLVGYSAACFVVGLFFVFIAYAATFRAVIPGKE